jgi:hypothetical protein
VWVRDPRLAFAPARVLMRDDAGNCTCIGDDGNVSLSVAVARSNPAGRAFAGRSS